MAFNFDFEALKKNFKDVTDKTVMKTGELTAIAKLNVTIKTEEAKLSDCYKSIGRLFYTAERDNLDNTEEIATYIMQADRIKATIADCQKELAVLRNVVVCEGCNNEIAGDAIFCPICGLKVNKPAPAPAEEAAEEPVDEAACDCGCDEASCDCGEETCCDETPCDCGCSDESCECNDGSCECNGESCDCDCNDESCDCGCEPTEDAPANE